MGLEQEFLEFEGVATRVLEGLAAENIALSNKCDSFEEELALTNDRLEMIMRELVSLRAAIEAVRDD